MASSVNPLTGSPATGSSGTASAANNLDTPSEGVFLNLLVAQIQNQDPLNPTDSTEFVTQLAQFSELEQVIAIRSDIESQIPGSATTTPATQTSNTTQAQNTSQS